MARSVKAWWQVTGPQLAQLLGLSDARIRRLCTEQGMPADQSGRYRKFDLREVVPWYIDYKSRPTTLQAELVAEQVRWARLRTDERLGELVTVDDAYTIVGGLVLQVARGLEAMSAGLAHDLDDDARRAVKAACRQLRSDLEHRIQQIEFVAPAEPDNDPADEPDDISVGHRRKAAAR